MLKRYTYLVLISLIWGSQFLLNDLALREVDAFQLAFLRASIGTVTLSLLLLFTKTRRLSSVPSSFKLQGYLFLIGLFEATLPFIMIAHAQHIVTSSMTALIMGVIPIFTILLAAAKGLESLSYKKVMSVALGMLGLLVLFWPSLVIHTAPNHILAELLIVLSAFCFALSLIMIRMLPTHNPIAHTRSILLWASVQLLVVGLFMSDHLFSFTTASMTTLAIVAMLGIFCGGTVYLLYVRIVHLAGPTFASLTNYFVPLVGILLGVCILNEAFHLREFIALTIIIAAVLMNH